MHISKPITAVLLAFTSLASAAEARYPTPTSLAAAAASSPATAGKHKSCEKQEHQCRTAMGANEAFCSSQRCACDGAKPYCQNNRIPGTNGTTSPGNRNGTGSGVWMYTGAADAMKVQHTLGLAAIIGGVAVYLA